MQKITLEQRFARALMVGGAGGAVALALMASEPALRDEWSIMRCALGGAFLAGLMLARGFGGTGCWLWFRAGFFFSLATVIGFCMAVMLIPLDQILVEHDLWQYAGVTAVAPFAGAAYLMQFLPDGVPVIGTWLAGMTGAALTARGCTAVKGGMLPARITSP